MSDESKKTSDHLNALRDKVRSSRGNDFDVDKLYENNFSWTAISEFTSRKENSDKQAQTSFAPKQRSHSNQSLYGANLSGENFKNTDFSNADLRDVNFSKANLEGADFSSADLSGADLSGANLNQAIFSGAKLHGTNFTGAKMHGVKLVEADIQDAILLDVDMDEIALQELQDLIEFLAAYYPHKLNLRRINLTLLDLSKIDLSRVNLRGVDFTGCNFTGVNIYELDLSECIISQAQIEQALGRPVTPKELKEILAPKTKKKKFKGIDLTQFFFSVGPAGVWDARKHPGVRIEDIMRAGKKLYDAFLKRQDSDEEIIEKFQNRGAKDEIMIQKERHERMRRSLEEKKYELRKEREEREYEKELLESQKKEYEMQKKQQLKDAQKKQQKTLESGYAKGRESR